MQVGTHLITETNAIEYFIIRFSGNKDLLGKDLKEEFTIKMVLGGVRDLRNLIITEVVFTKQPLT